MVSSDSKRAGDKGGSAEECLREYFRGLGSLAIRSIPVRQGTEDVTDVDLWVYTRASAHSRQISIVDVKNKRRGKAFERAVWVKGLQSTLRADEAIIASQGIGDSAQRFAERMNVRVVSRPVFDAIIKRYAAQEGRLSLEEVNEQWRLTQTGRTSVKARVELAKAEIASGLSFSSLNHWIDETADFIRLSIEREDAPGPLARAAYFCGALTAMGADFLGKHHSLSELSERREYFKEGLIFGRSGRHAGKTYLDFAENVVTEYLDPSGASAAKIRAGFERAIGKLPIQSLVENFSRPNASAELFKAALALEGACFSSGAIAFRDVESVEAKSLLGLISDYAGIPRRDVLGLRNGSGAERRTAGSNQDKLI